jgi:hypothetical protein
MPHSAEPATTAAPFDPADAYSEAKRRRELQERLRQIEEDVDARRRRFLAALQVIQGMVPSVEAEGSKAGDIIPLGRREPFADALAELCCVAEAERLQKSIEQVLNRDNENCSKNLRMAIYLFRLAHGREREKLVQQLKDIEEQLPRLPDAFDNQAISQRGIWECFADLLRQMGYDWGGGRTPGWLPELKEVFTLWERLSPVPSNPSFRNPLSAGSRTIFERSLPFSRGQGSVPGTRT